MGTLVCLQVLQVSLGMPSVVERGANGLFARTQLVQLIDGLLPIPKDASEIVLEIGTSDRNTMDVEYLPRAGKGAFLVAFEPLLDKYARALSRNKGYSGDVRQPLGFHHPQGIILPLAVGPSSGVSTFRVHHNSGCSSLLRTNADSNRLRWCAGVAETREVVVVTLEEALKWLGDRPVQLLKIDAQGLDLQVCERAEAAPSQSGITNQL
jgi:FkbM family methyltransferase